MGTIRLSAVHEGSQIVLRIADDGRGIDADAVRAAAVARGLAADGDALPEEDVYAFLFAAGFSTKAAVSELSGRGVGLDVVKAKVEALKGTVAITSTAGRGTTFTIRLPMTLAVTRALMVRTNGQTFAIPLDAVDQILRFDESDVQQIGREPVLKVGEVTYPVAHLGRVLNLKPTADDAAKRPPVLLIRAGDRRMALVVEQLLGGREIVIKSLGFALEARAGRLRGNAVGRRQRGVDPQSAGINPRGGRAGRRDDFATAAASAGPPRAGHDDGAARR